MIALINDDFITYCYLFFYRSLVECSAKLQNPIIACARIADESDECAPGTHFRPDGLACLSCPPGTYQPMTSRSQCENCSPPADGFIIDTEGVGATSQMQCHRPLPMLKSIDPDDGLQAGSTMVKIEGSNFLIDSNLTVAFGDNPGTIVASDASYIIVQSPPFTKMARIPSRTNGVTVPVEIRFSNGVTRSTSFVYRPNPSVDRFEPTTFVISGGQTIAVRGADFDAAQTHALMVQVSFRGMPYTALRSHCNLESPVLLLCKTPDLSALLPKATSSISRIKRQAAAGRQLHLQKPVCLSPFNARDWSFRFVFVFEQTFQISADADVPLGIYDDPSVDRWGQETVLSSVGDTITITGARFHCGIRNNDISVLVADRICDIRSIENDKIVCKPPRQRSANRIREPVMVQIGANVAMGVGYIQYQYSNIPTFLPTSAPATTTTTTEMTPPTRRRPRVTLSTATTPRPPPTTTTLPVTTPFWMRKITVPPTFTVPTPPPKRQYYPDRNFLTRTAPPPPPPPAPAPADQYRKQYQSGADRLYPGYERYSNALNYAVSSTIPAPIELAATTPTTTTTTSTRPVLRSWRYTRPPPPPYAAPAPARPAPVPPQPLPVSTETPMKVTTPKSSYFVTIFWGPKGPPSTTPDFEDLMPKLKQERMTTSNSNWKTAMPNNNNNYHQHKQFNPNHHLHHHQQPPSHSIADQRFNQLEELGQQQELPAYSNENQNFGDGEDDANAEVLIWPSSEPKQADGSVHHMKPDSPRFEPPAVPPAVNPNRQWQQPETREEIALNNLRKSVIRGNSMPVSDGKNLNIKKQQQQQQQSTGEEDSASTTTDNSFFHSFTDANVNSAVLIAIVVGATLIMLMLIIITAVVVSARARRGNGRSWKKGHRASKDPRHTTSTRSLHSNDSVSTITFRGAPTVGGGGAGGSSGLSEHGTMVIENGHVLSGTVGSPASRANLAAAAATIDRLPLVLHNKINDMLIHAKRIKVTSTLVRGQYGDICLGKLWPSNASTSHDTITVTIKTLNRFVMDLDSTSLIEAFLSDALMLKGFYHRNVSAPYAVAFSGQRPLVIYPYYENGSLKAYMTNKNKEILVFQLLDFASQIATAMVYLSAQNFVHKDLATRNCVVTPDFEVKVADNALVKDVYGREYVYVETARDFLPVRWMAPESLTDLQFSQKSDVWSFGVLLWELLTRGRLPHSHIHNSEIVSFLQNQVQQHTLGGTRPVMRLPRPSNVPPELCDIVDKCCQLEPSRRPTFGWLQERLTTLLDQRHMISAYNVPIMPIEGGNSPTTGT